MIARGAFGLAFAAAVAAMAPPRAPWTVDVTEARRQARPCVLIMNIDASAY